MALLPTIHKTLHYLFQCVNSDLLYSLSLPCKLRVGAVVSTTILYQQCYVLQEVLAAVVFVSCN